MNWNKTTLKSSDVMTVMNRRHGPDSFTTRQMTYWLPNGVMGPEHAQRLGSGHRRVFSMPDVLRLDAILVMNESIPTAGRGLGLDALKRVSCGVWDWMTDALGHPPDVNLLAASCEAGQEFCVYLTKDGAGVTTVRTWDIVSGPTLVSPWSIPALLATIQRWVAT